MSPSTAIRSFFAWNLLPATSLKAGMFLVDHETGSDLTLITAEPKLNDEHCQLEVPTENGRALVDIDAIMCVAKMDTNV